MRFSIMQASTSASFTYVIYLPMVSHTLSHAIQLKPTCTGGLVCAFSALLESIATLLRLDELKRLLLDPPPIVRMLLVPKLWLLLRLAFRLLPAPTPGFLEIKIKVSLLACVMSKNRCHRENKNATHTRKKTPWK